MQGRSVFAKFKARDELNGLSLTELKARVEASGFDSGLRVAIAKAIEQIEKVEAQKGSVTGAASGAAFKLA